MAALNHALRDIPADRVRLHMCWGNYEGPHHLDIPLTEIIDVALKAKVGALSFEGANPRHEHEWVIFKEFHLPDGLAIIPGVIDSTTNFVEHPELVAQRIVRYAEVVAARTSSRVQTAASVPSCAQSRQSIRASHGSSSSRWQRARPSRQRNFGISRHQISWATPFPPMRA